MLQNLLKIGLKIGLLVLFIVELETEPKNFNKICFWKKKDENRRLVGD
jgi:hypothetical protein